MKNFKNYEKCLLFHLKSFFSSGDIEFFEAFSLPFHSFILAGWIRFPGTLGRVKHVTYSFFVPKCFVL